MSPEDKAVVAVYLDTLWEAILHLESLATEYARQAETSEKSADEAKKAHAILRELAGLE